MLLISTERRRVLSLPLVSGAATLALGLGLGAMVSAASRSGIWQWGLLGVMALILTVAATATAIGLRGARRVGDELRWFSVTGRGRHPALRCDLWPVSRQGRPNTFDLELRDEASDELLFEVFSIVHGPKAETYARRTAAALELPLALPDPKPDRAKR